MERADGKGYERKPGAETPRGGRGTCMRRWTRATRPGFEPGKTGPKPVVIPFHHRVKVQAFYRPSPSTGRLAGPGNTVLGLLDVVGEVFELDAEVDGGDVDMRWYG